MSFTARKNSAVDAITRFQRRLSGEKFEIGLVHGKHESAADHKVEIILQLRFELAPELDAGLLQRQRGGRRGLSEVRAVVERQQLQVQASRITARCFSIGHAPVDYRHG